MGGGMTMIVTVCHVSPWLVRVVCWARPNRSGTPEGRMRCHFRVCTSGYSAMVVQ